jgi:predicted nucleotide-binding protein
MRHVPFATELPTLNGPWTSHVLDTAIRLLGVDRQPRLLLIHGRSLDRYILTEWLRATLGLNDLLIMQQEFGAGQSLPEKFESLAAQADGAIAIATPDDAGGLADGAPQNMRARQNVWLEVGWIWGRLGRNKVMVLCKGDLEIPSDLHGLEYYRYNSSPLEVTESVRAFVRQLTGKA